MLELADIITKDILAENDILVIIDSDADGFTSAAILCNYLYAKYPEWVDEGHLKFIFHEGKQHGFNDVLGQILKIHNETPLGIIIAPDGGSNDISAHKQLHDLGIYCATLDHHIVENENIFNPYCNVINIQLTDYPNKSLTGAGVTWKFCQCMDEYLAEHPERLSPEPQADKLIDLAALGDIGDMASLKELEIRALVNIGLNNIDNDFFKGMTEKNAYSINKMNGINYYSTAFYVVPFINALVRSGTQEEKQLIFDSMLDYKSTQKVESSKRGHKGEQVYLWEEAILVADRVKRRQTKYQNDMLDVMKEKIDEGNLDNHAVIVIKCEPGEVERNLAGLIANKLMAQYQHPCMIVTHGVDDNGEIVYSGSARNIPNSPIEDLREFCEQSPFTNFASGHPSAFGLAFPDQQVDNFVEYADKYCRDNDIKFEPIYKIDYLWEPGVACDMDKIMEIAKFNIYGQDIPESYVAVENIPLNESNVTLMSPDKHPTIKLMLDNGVEIIKFGSSQREYEQWAQSGQTVNIVGKCQVNEWNGKTTPQILVQDFDIENKWVF